MKKAAAILLAVCLLVTGTSAQAATADLNLSVDWAAFANPADNSSYVEFYFGLQRHQLGFIGSDSTAFRYAGILLTATVFDEAGQPIDSASTYFLSRVASEEEQTREGVQLFDNLLISMRPGKYRVMLTAIDDVSKAIGKRTGTVMVPDYTNGGLHCSDLELAHEIRPVAEEGGNHINSRLVKEDLLVVPNPSGAYDQTTESSMYVYAELYGLSLPQPGTDTAGGRFTVQYTLKDSSGSMVHDFGMVEYATPGESAVLTKTCPITDIPPGDYNLVFEAVDMMSSRRTLAVKPVTLVSATAPEQKLNEQDVELMVNMAWYHLSEAGKIQVQKLTLEGKKNFIRQFWRQQDNDPSNPQNPVYDNAVRRFVYANEYFSTGIDRHDGWKTDRGRVYITYGPYDEDVNVDLEGRRYPYIKWTYHNLDGRRIFVFVNDVIAGATGFRLVHSTHPREIYDPSWQQVLEEDLSPEEDWRDPRDVDYQDPKDIHK